MCHGWMPSRGTAGLEFIRAELFADALGRQAPIAGEGCDKLVFGALRTRNREVIGQFAQTGSGEGLQQEGLGG